MTEEPCLKTHSRRQFVLKERRSEVRFENPERHKIDQFQVDGCLMKEGLKCDHLINVGALEATFFVELKGKDVHHAMKQLQTSHERLKERHLSRVHWVVATTRCPLSTSDIQERQIQVRRRHRARLTVGNSPLTIPLK